MLAAELRVLSAANPRAGPQAHPFPGLRARAKQNELVSQHRKPAPQPAPQSWRQVLSGGIVPGSVTLISGDPGVGKSTLLLQLAGALCGGAATASGVAPPSALSPVVLFVSGEERSSAVAMRARRLDLSNLPIHVMAEPCIEEILIEAGFPFLYARAFAAPLAVSGLSSCGSSA